MAERQRDLPNRWLIVAGAVVIQVCLGAVYAWSLFNQPLMEGFGWPKEGVVLTFSITMATFATFTLIAGILQDKYGPRWVATTGGMLLGTGVMLSSQATSLIELYLFYGLLGGAGIGTAYVCPLATCLKWFPDKKGLISGIAVAGVGAGGLIFKPLILGLMTVLGVMTTFFYIGLIYLILVVGGAQLLRLPPPGYKPSGWNPPPQVAEKIERDFTTGQMLKTYQFYLLWFMFLFGCTAGMMIISIAADIGVRLVGLEPLVAANAVSIIALFNAGGRLSWGTISDRWGRTLPLFFMYGITALTMYYLRSFSLGYASYLLAVSLIAFCFGGFLAIFPPLITEYYGVAHFGNNYGLIFLANGFSAILGPRLATIFPFPQAFLLAAVISIIGLTLTFFVKLPPAPEK